MDLTKYPRSEWRGARVLVVQKAGARTPLHYEAEVIEWTPRSPRVLVRPVEKRTHAIPKWFEAEKLEPLEVGQS